MRGLLKTPVMTAPPRIALRLLGGFALELDGQPCALAYEKGRALLAYLAIENRWLSRELLSNLFWPDLFGHRANLRQVLHNLRSVLQDNAAALPCLLVRRDAVSMSTEYADRLDVTSFLAEPPECAAAGAAPDCAPCLRRMEQAQELYRGEFMAGFALPDCADFEEWLQRQREALRRHAIALCGRLADCHERHGAMSSALAYARRTTELDPWNEAVQRRLMRLLAVSGQSAAALRQYDELEATLAREIGVQPEAATREVCQRIRAGDGGIRQLIEGDWAPRSTAAASSPAAGEAQREARSADEIRRVVVLQVEPDLNDEAELLEPERHLAPLAAALDAVLLRWSGRRFSTTGLALGAVFGLVDDGEQAPRRALQAALELAALPEFARTRIGICEGKALMGPEARPSMVGSTLPALAQRLALCGEAGEVIAAESLAGELRPRARFEPLPRRRFTGLAGEHTPCRLALAPEASSDPYPLAFCAPFVGRRDERTRLTAELAAVGKHNCAAFIEVTGHAGEGKSRLLAELAREHRAAGGEFRWIAHRPELRHVSLGGLREALRRRIGALDRSPQSAGDEGLDDWLERLFAARQDELRAPLRALLAPESEAAANISGRGLIDALTLLLFSPSIAKQPVLLVFDDLHWADEATRELLSIAMQSPPRAAVLAVLAGRPEARVAPPEDVSIPLITLQPLAMSESLILIAAIDQGGRIDAAQRFQLAKASGGLPLCTEYIARTARDQPVSDASLFGVLQSVLDRLGPHKLILQAAAVLGASFHAGFLRALLPQHDLAAALQQAEALAVSTQTGEDSYAFCHALLRDCAYQSIPPKLRRDWHHLAATWLGQQGDAAPADIAQHFEAAEAWREAFDAWSKAAEKAYLGEFAGDAREAAVRALTIASREGAAFTEADRDALELLAGYANLMSKGYGAKDAQRFFAPIAARETGTLADETLIRALCGMAAAIPQGRHETMAIMQRLESLARTPTHRMMVCYGFGSLYFWRGDFALSLRHLEEAIQVGETLASHEWLRYSADSPVVACRALAGINLAFSGSAETARTVAARAVAEGRREGRAHGLCFALTMAASVHLMLDQPEAVERFAAEGLELATQRQFPLWRGYNTLFGMWAKARQGRLRLSASFKLISMHREFAAASRLSPVTASWFAGCIFEAMESWILLDASTGRALSLAHNGGDRYCMADLMRQKSLARHGRGDVAGAQHWLAQARVLAESMGNHGLIPRLDQLAALLDQGKG